MNNTTVNFNGKQVALRLSDEGTRLKPATSEEIEAAKAELAYLRGENHQERIAFLERFLGDPAAPPAVSPIHPAGDTSEKPLATKTRKAEPEPVHAHIKK